MVIGVGVGVGVVGAVIVGVGVGFDALVFADGLGGEARRLVLKMPFFWEG